MINNLTIIFQVQMNTYVQYMLCMDRLQVLEDKHTQLYGY